MAGPDPQALRAAADLILELHDAGELTAARDACLRLERDAGDDLSDRVVRESVFLARFERGAIAVEEDDLEEAATAYLAAAALPFDLSDPDESHELAMALINAGVARSVAGDEAAALAIYNDVLSQLADATDPVTRGQVVRARVNRAAALLELDRPGEAIRAVEELIPELDLDEDDDVEQYEKAVLIRDEARNTLR